MDYEMDVFRKAARDAGIRGKDWQGFAAIKNFTLYYRAKWAQWEQEEEDYEGVFLKARRWWLENAWKYL